MKPWLGNRLRELPIRAYVTVSATDKYTLQDADSSVDHTAEGSTVTTVNFGLGIEFKSCQGYVTYINQAGEEVVNRGILDWVNTADDYYYIWFSGLTSWEFPTVYIHGDIKYLQTFEGIYDTVNVSGTSINNLQTSALIAGNEKWVYNVIATNCSQLTDGGKFYVRDTHIKSVDVSGSALDYVNLYSGTNKENVASLTDVTANNMPNLSWLQINYQTGTTAGLGVNVQINNCPNFAQFYAWHSTLGNIQISGCENLTNLWLNNTNHTTGTVTIQDAKPYDAADGLVDLHIYANGSGLTAEDLENLVQHELTYVKTIEAANARFSGDLDLSECVNMTEYVQTHGETTQLNLSGCSSCIAIDLHTSATPYLQTLILPTAAADTALTYLNVHGQARLTEVSTDGGQTYSTELALSYPNLQSITIYGWTQNIGFVGIGSDAVGSTREPAYENNALTSVNVNSAGIKNCAVRVAEGNTTFTTLTVNNALERLSVRGTSAYLPKTYPTNLYGLSFTYCHFHVQGLTLSSLVKLKSVDIGHTEFAGVAVPDIDLPTRTANDGSLYMSTDSEWFEDVADKATALGWAVYNSDTGVKVRDAAYVAPSTDATVTE